MKILPFIFLTLHHAFRVASTEKHGRHFSRGALITKANRRLGGHVVASLKSPSLISCGQACLSHSRCFSTNFHIYSPPGKVNCELNDQGVVSWRADSILPKMEGFVFSQYKREKADTGCQQTQGCLNGGSCELISGTVVCFCASNWEGERCEKRKKDVFFHFTNLGSTGRKGPTSDAGYQGTSLEGHVTVLKGLQTWYVPVTGHYQVEACGASGGNSFIFKNKKGGVGAKVTGTVFVPQGTVLDIIVGQKGNEGGGGGGTFVVFSDDETPLIIAGGGGGADKVAGDPGQLGQDGSVNGGIDGGGGMVCIPGESMGVRGLGGGGGFDESGFCYEGKGCRNEICSNGGTSFISGSLGGRNQKYYCVGGFGGGGSCGGGGGYSGGGVQVEKKTFYFHAGGGGSYKRDNQWVVTQDCKRGHGYVLFTLT